MVKDYFQLTNSFEWTLASECGRVLGLSAMWLEFNLGIVELLTFCWMMRTTFWGRFCPRCSCLCRKICCCLMEGIGSWFAMAFICSLGWMIVRPRCCNFEAMGSTLSFQPSWQKSQIFILTLRYCSFLLDSPNTEPVSFFLIFSATKLFRHFFREIFNPLWFFTVIWFRSEFRSFTVRIFVSHKAWGISRATRISIACRG